MANAAGNPANPKGDESKPAKDPVRDVVIVIASLVTLVILAALAILRYSDSKDAASVLGVIVPGISTIGAAAFGVAAGKAAGEAGKKAAEDQLNSTKKDTGAKADDLEAKINTLETAFSPTADTVRLLPSAAGQRFHKLSANETPGVDISFDPEHLDTVRETIASMRQGVRDLKD